MDEVAWQRADTIVSGGTIRTLEVRHRKEALIAFADGVRLSISVDADGELERSLGVGTPENERRIDRVLAGEQPGPEGPNR